MLTHLSLFSGIGGLDLAAEWAGFRTVGQCEWADYPTGILEKHWPEVPRWRDIRTLTLEDFYARTGMRTVDIISGGFPCQPFSVAGKQKGKGDERYLWPEMRRVIAELTPRWVLGENVPGILRIAACDIVADLEREGYDVVLFDFEAAAVGAKHRRERIAFVANEDSGFMENTYSNRCIEQEVLSKQQRRAKFERPSKTMANSMCNGQFATEIANRCWERQSTEDDRENRIKSWWTFEPNVGRVAHGIPDRVDRIKCLGNAVVPQQFYPIFKAIAEIEMEAKV